MEYPAYENYKKTKYDWMKNIPSGWDTMNLSHAVRMKSGDNITSLEILPSGEYPVYGGNGVRGYFNNHTHSGDYILIGRQGALCGNIKLVQGDFWASEHAVVVTPDRKLEIGWLGYLLASMNLNQYSVSAAQPGLSVESIGRLKIPFPTKDEQQKIASFLDYKTQQIDQLIEKKKTLIEKLGEQRIAVITQAVTKGLDKNAKMKPSGVDWLGDVPEGWDIMHLSHAVRMKSGESITSLEILPEGTYPVYGGNGIRGYFDEYTHNGKHILIGRQGALCGNIKLVRCKFWASEHAVVVTPDKELDLGWLAHLLATMNLNQYSVSAAQPGLSVEVIGRLKIPFPPVNIQEEIKNKIEISLRHIDKMIYSSKRAISILKEYRGAIITDSVTGKIDVRNVKTGKNVA